MIPPRSSSPCRKKSRTTCAEFKLLTAKSSSSQFNSPSSTSRNNSLSTSSNQSHNNIESSSINRPKSYTAYHVFRPSEGIDLTTFHQTRLHNHIAPNNVCNIISRLINSHEVIQQIDSTSNNDNEDNSNSINDIEISYNSSILASKHRCVVEDFMMLPQGHDICLLLPKLRRKQKETTLHQNLKIVCEKSTIMFGNDRNLKYYIFTGAVQSNKYLPSILNDSITHGDIMDAFRVGRNNGYGLHIDLSQ